MELQKYKVKMVNASMGLLFYQNSLLLPCIKKSLVERPSQAILFYDPGLKHLPSNCQKHFCFFQRLLTNLRKCIYLSAHDHYENDPLYANRKRYVNGRSM
jgi:hypothetical protein